MRRYTAPGFEVVVPDPPPRWHESPLVTLEQSRTGAVSASSWCVACPREGAASPHCCANAEYLARAEAEREAAYALMDRPNPARRSSSRFAFLRRRRG